MYRSRLQRLEEKRNIKSAVLFSIGTVIVIGIMVVMGIPFLVRMAIFMGDLRTNGVTIDKNDLIPPGPPIILSDFDATYSATISVGGVAESGATIYLDSNGKSVGEVVVDDSGTWRVDDVSLDPGDNLFEAVAVDLSGNKSQISKLVKIWFSNKKPALEISFPVNGYVVSGGSGKIEIGGMTDPKVHLTMNDRLVIVGGDGKFLTTYNLTLGDNPLNLVAKDKAGNVTQKEISVKYSP